jgi:hypothetical protein
MEAEITSTYEELQKTEHRRNGKQIASIKEKQKTHH